MSGGAMENLPQQATLRRAVKVVRQIKTMTPGVGPSVLLLMP